MKQLKIFFKSFWILVISFAFQTNYLYAGPAPDQSIPLVAVVADAQTYQKISTEIDGYIAAIQKDGKRAILLVDIWNQPDSIRNRLQQFYRNDLLEGAVLIGDIPVAMIRDAQHLSNAFKMDQTRNWKESSIPSDRFYDDFDLKFDYIRQDSTENLYHYYTLKSASAQVVTSDIYSARIKSPVIPGKDKYQALSEYLKKVIAGKQTQRTLSQVLLFTGHGYNSESLNARLDEEWALKHHFPFLENKRDGRLDFINYDTDNYVRERLFAKLGDPDLDLAILHHHGAEDTQYLGETPKVNTPQQQIEGVKSFLRSKIRNAKDTTEAKNYYLKNFDVPSDWMDKAFDPQTAEADSLSNAQLNIDIKDTYGRIFQPGFIMFDACFNGSFHLNDYISGHYIFNPGRTIVTRANSVNALQDMWPDELIGLLNEGVCVGNWAKETFTLESHLIGDPTFHYSNKKSTLDKDIVKEAGNPKFWRKLSATGNPSDVRALALLKLQKNKAITSAELLSFLKEDADPVVRLEAFVLLKKRLSPLLTQAIQLAMNDSYELTRRLAILTAGKSGDPALLPSITESFFDPALTVRERFQLQYAIEQYPYDTIASYFSQRREKSPGWPLPDRYAAFLENLKRNADSKKADILKLNDTTAKQRRLVISSQRNMCQTEYLNELFDYLKNGDNKPFCLLLSETFGWYLYSYRRNEILAFCKTQQAVEQDIEIKNELEKTINRLSASF